MPIDVRGLAPLIQVFDMPTSVSFYCDTLGFKLLSKSSDGDDFHWALLRFNEAQLMLNTAYDDGQRPPKPEPARVAAHSDTGLFMSCPDVDAAYRHLVERGVAVKPPTVAPYRMKQLWVTDPDGYILCFQWPSE